VLDALVETDGTPAAVANEVGAREETVADALHQLADVGVVARDGSADVDHYRIR